MSRHPVWLTPLALLISLLCAVPAIGQEDQDEELLAGLHSPSAFERETARAGLDTETLLKEYRKWLREGNDAPHLITALERLGRRKHADDIGLIIKYIGDLDPGVAQAAMGALRAYGRDALKAVEALPPGQVDNATRKDVIEQLLKDHIFNACRRDMAVNPFQLPYAGRTAELYSVDHDLNELMFRMVRDALSDIREDVAGNRYYYYGYNYTGVRPFIEYGALAIHALEKHDPERLARELAEVSEVQPSNDFWGWGYSSRTPVTVEVAGFFARRGDTALIDKVISDFESGTRWRQPAETLGIQARIAAMQMVALGELDAALDRLNENVRHAGSALSGTVSQAHYLRARILMKLGEEGAALHALEDSMESSNMAMVLTLVDDAFEPLTGERRFQAVIEYCRLAARRLSVSQRPWGFTEEDATTDEAEDEDTED
jgi:hypothetical protein